MMFTTDGQEAQIDMGVVYFLWPRSAIHVCVICCCQILGLPAGDITAWYTGALSMLVRKAIRNETLDKINRTDFLTVYTGEHEAQGSTVIITTWKNLTGIS